MPEPQLSGPAAPAFDTAVELIERILTACADLAPDQLDAVPFAESSPLYVIATHAISATEWNFVHVLAGQAVDRSREAEFDSRAAAQADPQAVLQARWDAARAAIAAALGGLSEEAWDGPHYHMFMERNLSGYELVDRAIAHTAEHVGHAELTRQWLDSQTAVEE